MHEAWSRTASYEHDNPGDRGRWRIGSTPNMRLITANLSRAAQRLGRDADRWTPTTRGLQPAYHTHGGKACPVISATEKVPALSCLTWHPHRIWPPPVKLGNAVCLIWPPTVKLGNTVCLIWHPPVNLGKPRLPHLASPCQIRQLQSCLIWPPD